MVHLYADDTQLYIKLCCENLENTKVKMAACIHHIQSLVCIHAPEAECNENRTHLVWPPKQTGWWQENKESEPWPTMQYLMWFVPSVFSWTADLTWLNMSPPRPKHAFSTFTEFDKWDVVLTKHVVVFLFKLSSFLGSAARVIKDLSPRDHITPTLKQRQWLPIHARIAFKIFLLMYHIHSRTSPS